MYRIMLYIYKSIHVKTYRYLGVDVHVYKPLPTLLKIWQITVHSVCLCQIRKTIDLIIYSWSQKINPMSNLTDQQYCP